jgi:hypothetical protein
MQNLKLISNQLKSFLTVYAKKLSPENDGKNWVFLHLLLYCIARKKFSAFDFLMNVLLLFQRIRNPKEWFANISTFTNFEKIFINLS